jgi:hypothetical protein
VTGPERVQVDLLLAEVRQLRSELAEVRGELDALDRGVIATGETADLALARADALGAVMAAPFEVRTRPGLRPAPFSLIQGGAS